MDSYLHEKWQKVTALLSVVLGVIGVLLIPLLTLVYRGAQKWTRVEGKLGTAVDRLDQIVVDNEKIHGALYDQMKYDRDATNQRLTYLERLWIEEKRR